MCYIDKPEPEYYTVAVHREKRREKEQAEEEGEKNNNNGSNIKNARTMS